jgi:hypothetical protein
VKEWLDQAQYNEYGVTMTKTLEGAQAAYHEAQERAAKLLPKMDRRQRDQYFEAATLAGYSWHAIQGDNTTGVSEELMDSKRRMDDLLSQLS